MKFTMRNELPTEPGAYWYMDTRFDEKPYVVTVRMFVHDLAIGNCRLGDKIYPYEFYSERIPEPEMQGK